MQYDRNANIHRRNGAYLPHWTCLGGTYSVTFRLADSLPLERLEELRWMRQNLELVIDDLRSRNDPTAFVKEINLWRIFSSRADSFLDAGSGSCRMQDPDVADLVAKALQFFDGTRYILHAWAVMPNHAHVVFTPLAQHELSAILKSWKGFTAKKLNEVLDCQGMLWQRESYDHLVRNQEDFNHHVNYVLTNPAVAGLANWRWAGSGPRSAGWVPPSKWLSP
jgi:REP element-mobilizing transposase RayT